MTVTGSTALDVAVTLRREPHPRKLRKRRRAIGYNPDRPSGR